jgi:hypothetical protein
MWDLGCVQQELNNNDIHRLEDINVLKKYTPGLFTLSLRHNPICDNKTYKVKSLLNFKDPTKSRCM